MRHAVSLAKQNNGKLVVLHVIPPIDVTDIETFRPEMVLQSLKKEGEQILSDIKVTCTDHGVEAETRLEVGIPDEKICEVADTADADLIVMGSHGRTGFGKVFIGSITERVISKEKCRPVLVVK